LLKINYIFYIFRRTRLRCFKWTSNQTFRNRVPSTCIGIRNIFRKRKNEVSSIAQITLPRRSKLTNKIDFFQLICCIKFNLLLNNMFLLAIDKVNIFTLIKLLLNIFCFTTYVCFHLYFIQYNIFLILSDYEYNWYQLEII